MPESLPKTLCCFHTEGEAVDLTVDHTSPHPPTCTPRTQTKHVMASGDVGEGRTETIFTSQICYFG